MRNSNGRFETRYNHLSFVEAGNIKWNNRFTYLSEFQSMRKKMLIRCNNCMSEFQQRPYCHLDGSGCKTCYYKEGKKRISFNEFVSRSILKFGPYFSFDEKSYRGIRFKVSWTCLKCKNLYMQIADSHLRGYGCHFCVNHEVSKSETLWLDQLQIPVECRNITILDPNGKNKRNKFKVDALVDNVIYEFYGKYYHGDPREYAGSSKHGDNGVLFSKLYNNTVMRQSRLEAMGYTVRFVWELDWKKGQQFSECHPHQHNCKYNYF